SRSKNRIHDHTILSYNRRYSGWGHNGATRLARRTSVTPACSCFMICNSDSELSPDAVDAALKRLLADESLVRSRSLSRLLAYMVERAKRGDTEIKEYDLAVDVFDRPETFDPKDDTIVRVQVRKL